MTRRDAIATPGAELAVITAAFTHPAVLREIDLEAGEFFDLRCRVAWAAIREIQATAGAEAVELQAVADRLASQARVFGEVGPLAWLATALGSHYSAVAATYEAGVVRRDAALRALAALSGEIADHAWSDSPDLPAALQRVREALAGIESRDTVGGPVPLAEAVAPALARIEANASGDGRVEAIPTGITGVDGLAQGGARPGELWVIGGRPGHGKTSLAVGIVHHAAQHETAVLLFSLEMLIQPQIERLLSAETKVSAGEIGSGSLDVAAWRRILAAGSKLSRLPFWVDDRSRSLDGILATARRWHSREGRNHRRQLILVDYLQIVKPRQVRGRNREQEIAEMSREFKELASALKCPVVILSQLSREMERDNRRPQLRDLRESGSLEQDADVVLFPWREPEELPDGSRRAPSGSGPAEIDVAKNRHGPTGLVKCEWKAPWMRFENEAPRFGSMDGERERADLQ